MNSRIWVVGVGLSFVLGGWAPAWAANYYVDDGSNDGDVWTPTAYGLDINNGLTPATPKATLANLIGTVALATFWLSGFSRKVGPVHRASGKIYLLP